MDFCFNLEAIVDFVFDQTESEKNNNIVTTVTYPLSNNGNVTGEIGQREVSEQKNAFNDTACNIRYDLVKFFIGNLLDYTEEPIDSDNLSFRQKVALNTLYNNDMIKIVKE